MQRAHSLPRQHRYDHKNDRDGPALSSQKIPDKVYRTLCRLRPDTKLSFSQRSPHHGIWAGRYAKYCKATNLAQYVKLGGLSSDIAHDLMRGIVTIKGPFRKDCMTEAEAKGPVDDFIAGFYFRGDDTMLSKIKELKERVKDVNLRRQPYHMFRMVQLLDVKTPKSFPELSPTTLEALYVKNKGLGGGSYAFARLVVNRLATEILKQKKISDVAVLCLLRLWAQPKNSARKNVMSVGQAWVYSGSYGLLSHREAAPRVTDTTRKYSDFFKLLSRWAHQQFRKKFPGKKELVFTSICINKNYNAAPHVDVGNYGPSAIIALGDFKGGQLQLWPGKKKTKQVCTVDIRNKLLLFNGNHLHSAKPFSGKDRYSVVFFTVKKYDKSAPSDVKFIRSTFDCWPSKKALEGMEAA